MLKRGTVALLRFSMPKCSTNKASDAMTDFKSLARIGRLLNGALRPDDLTNLFLYARDRCNGRESVREIGDFVAHHSERTKGIVTRTTRDFFAIARYHAPCFGESVLHPLDLKKLPSVTPVYLMATIHRLENKVIKRQCGMAKNAALNGIGDLIGNLLRNSDGSFSSEGLNQSQRNILIGLSSVICVQPAFDGLTLCNDFKKTLLSNGLLSKETEKQFDKLFPLIQVFALSVMHNTKIIMNDGSVVILQTTPISNNLSTVASIQTGNTAWMTEMFTTELSIADHCDPPLLAEDNWSSFNFDVDQNGRLCKL
jgi:hypothetical protein